MASVHDQWFVNRKRPDGSLIKERTARHGSGKRWLVRWRDANGEPRKKSFMRKADADREKSRLETELARGTYIDPNAGRQKGPSPDCGYTYRLRSLPERTAGAGRWPVTATSVWTVTWAGTSNGAPVTGVETLRVSTSTSLAVGEIQVLVAGDGT
jgi:hypothetical protein